MKNTLTAVNPIGGYIELQLPTKNEYYPSLKKLNTGRNSLEYILKVKGYTRIYLPYFTCEVLLEPIKKLKIDFEFYHIDNNLDPVIDFEIGSNECFVYNNYFGLKQQTVTMLSKVIPNLIVDNSQAFFSAPLEGVDTFYSCRKFFGVPDGSYLSINSETQISLEEDNSTGRFSHLIKSINCGIEAGYADYVKNNEVLMNNSIKKMSLLTERLLSAINYRECKARRNSNFKFLNKMLEKHNELGVQFKNINGPMAYPLLISKPGLREKLIQQKIFIPTFWPNVFDWTSTEMFENHLAKNLLPIPVDHRYDTNDMKHVVNTIINFL
ncbi:hypothetical protein WG906_12865 [Pedobacter sp. P351]|uniref:hypothetical protein n=1 Tax=Pedobacter superstes TaxID=3133441 RepID=UPI003096E6ED